MNNDGYADVIVGAPFDDDGGIGSGSATVFSGIDGSVLYKFNDEEFGYNPTTPKPEKYID